jgi:hypothetical protein
MTNLLPKFDDFTFWFGEEEDGGSSSGSMEYRGKDTRLLSSSPTCSATMEREREEADLSKVDLLGDLDALVRFFDENEKKEEKKEKRPGSNNANDDHTPFVKRKRQRREGTGRVALCVPEADTSRLASSLAFSEEEHAARLAFVPSKGRFVPSEDDVAFFFNHLPVFRVDMAKVEGKDARRAKIERWLRKRPLRDFSDKARYESRRKAALSRERAADGSFKKDKRSFVPVEEAMEG